MRPAALLTRRRARRAAAFAAGGMLAAGVLAGPLTTAPAAAAERRGQPLTDQSVTVDVLDVTPSTPARSADAQPLTVTLGLTNTTDQQLDGLVVRADRSNPIASQAQLDAAIAKPQEPDPNQVAQIAPKDGREVTASLPPRGSTTVRYETTTGLAYGSVGLCLCADAIYPLYFHLHYRAPDGTETVVGTGQTYLPAFGKTAPQPLRVSWVWPIIDRPHRLSSDRVFIDDDLTNSVTTGRLNRVLQVVEQVAADVPLTLVIDPDLIDELQVMSTGKYEVSSAGKSATPGTGSAAAAAWLVRLRAVLDRNPSLEVHFTPFADPDVETLARNNLSWTVGMATPEAAQRVSEALGGRVPTSRLVWPAGELLSADTLNTVRGNGASTVIVNDHTLPGARTGAPKDALAPLQTTTGPVTAAVTSTAIQRYVAPVLSIGGSGARDLPKLVAQVALRSVVDPTRPQYVVITPPRYVDPSPVAERAIRDTARTFWASPVTVIAAEQSVAAVDQGGLTRTPATSDALPPFMVYTAQRVTAVLPGLRSMLTPNDATDLLSGFPVAVQRTESSAWREAPALGSLYAEQLNKQIDAFESGVFIVKPSSGTYTLASDNSPLPVAITNRLNVSVQVRLRISTVNRVPGVTAKDIGIRQVAPQTTLNLHIPLDVQRTGRFQVQAELFTPADTALGQPVVLSIHSTALGTVGVVITVIAAAVLALALLVRIIRRIGKRGRPTPADEPEPVVVP